MTATYTFDVFTILDVNASDGPPGGWGGYWGDWPDATVIGGDAVQVVRRMKDAPPFEPGRPADRTDWNPECVGRAQSKPNASATNHRRRARHGHRTHH